MRTIVLCTALCIAYSTESSAELWSDNKLHAKATAFAYVTSHAVKGSDSANRIGLRPTGAKLSELVAIREAAEKDTPDRESRTFSKRELCSAAASVAEANNLPVPFFANLIQQESGFKSHVVSPAGAQGIAQFMPRVAAAYGLTDPFHPIKALTAAGKFLAELVGQFGNLGLAAAAYNAGPKRVQDWIAKRRKLPAETQHYVKSITGRPAEQWTRSAGQAPVQMPPHARCSHTDTITAENAEPATTRIARGRSRGRKSQFVLSGPAAQRFAAWTPAIIAPEKKTKRTRHAHKRWPAKNPMSRALARKNGPAIVTRRVRVATAP